MGETRTTGDTGNAAADRSRLATVVLWVLQVPLAFQFVMAGLVELFGEPAMVEMFATIGQRFRYAVGTMEVAGAVGSLMPRLSGLAAIGLVCLMADSAPANPVILDEGPLLPLGLLVMAAVMAAVMAWRRRPGTRTRFRRPGCRDNTQRPGSIAGNDSAWFTMPPNTFEVGREHRGKADRHRHTAYLQQAHHHYLITFTNSMVVF